MLFCRAYLNLCYENVYNLCLSETRHVFEEIAELLPQENITKLQPERSVNKLLDRFKQAL
jgi:hypothetical protein